MTRITKIWIALVTIGVLLLAFLAFTLVQNTPTAEGGATVDGPEEPGETVAGPAVTSMPESP